MRPNDKARQKIKSKFMQQVVKLEYQIKAILRRAEEGKIKNLYAARNKIKTLRKQQEALKQQQNWYNYLAQ